MMSQDEILLMQSTQTAASRYIRERVRQTSTAISTWREIQSSSEAYADPEQRSSYVHERLERLSLEDLITIAGVSEAGLL